MSVANGGAQEFGGAARESVQGGGGKEGSPETVARLDCMRIMIESTVWGLCGRGRHACPGIPHPPDHATRAAERGGPESGHRQRRAALVRGRCERTCRASPIRGSDPRGPYSFVAALEFELTSGLRSRRCSAGRTRTGVRASSRRGEASRRVACAVDRSPGGAPARSRVPPRKRHGRPEGPGCPEPGTGSGSLNPGLTCSYVRRLSYLRTVSSSMKSFRDTSRYAVRSTVTSTTT